MPTTTASNGDGEGVVWMSTKEAAEVLGLPVRKLYRLIDEGELPAYKFGRVIRLRRGEVAAYRDGGSGESPRDG